MKIALICDNCDQHFLNIYKKYDYIIGIDKGAFNILKNNIICNVAIGDFDSVKIEEMEFIQKKAEKFIKYNIEKDYTDLELALKLCEKNSDIDIYISEGKRFDHLITQMILLIKIDDKNITLYNKNNKIYKIKSGENKIKYNNNYKYISFYTVKNNICTIKNMKYIVTKYKMHPYTTLMTSNQQLSSKESIVICSEDLIILQSND